MVIPQRVPPPRCKAEWRLGHAGQGTRRAALSSPQVSHAAGLTMGGFPLPYTGNADISPLPSVSYTKPQEAKMWTL